MGGRTDGRTDRRRTHARTHACTDRRTDGWVHGRTGGRTQTRRYGEDCKTCYCKGGDMLTAAQFRGIVAEINRRDVFGFVVLEAGPMNVRRPAADDWQRWTSKGFNSGNETEMLWLYRFFGVPFGGGRGDEHMSPYIELFSMPVFDTLGEALKRGSTEGPSVLLDILLNMPTANAEGGWADSEAA